MKDFYPRFEFCIFPAIRLPIHLIIRFVTILSASNPSACTWKTYGIRWDTPLSKGYIYQTLVLSTWHLAFHSGFSHFDSSSSSFDTLKALNAEISPNIWKQNGSRWRGWDRYSGFTSGRGHVLYTYIKITPTVGHENMACFVRLVYCSAACNNSTTLRAKAAVMHWLKSDGKGPSGDRDVRPG